MSEHPIECLMKTAMNSIQDMVDVNTIIGEPIETSNDIMIIPISKVCFGFAAGGSEFNSETLNEYKKKEKEEEMQYSLPFGGGSGAGVTINPVAFLVINKDTIKLMPINHTSTFDKIIDYMPDVLEKLFDKEKCDESKINENEQNEKNQNENIETKKSTIIKKEISKVQNADYLEDE